MQTTLRVIAVGSVIPDTPEYRTPAFSRAGNRTFSALIQGVATDARVHMDSVLSFIPVPAYPRGPLCFARPATHLAIGPLTSVRLMPFVNVNPIKPLMLGIRSFLEIAFRFAVHPRCARVVLCYNLSSPPGLFPFAAARLTGARIVGLIYDIDIPGETVSRTVWRRLDYNMQRYSCVGWTGPP